MNRTNRVEAAAAAEATMAAAPTEAVEKERKESCYANVWLPHEEEQPVPPPTAGQISSGKGAVDVVGAIDRCRAASIRLPCLGNGTGGRGQKAMRSTDRAG